MHLRILSGVEDTSLRLPVGKQVQHDEKENLPNTYGKNTNKRVELASFALT